MRPSSGRDLSAALSRTRWDGERNAHSTCPGGDIPGPGRRRLWLRSPRERHDFDRGHDRPNNLTDDKIQSGTFDVAEGTCHYNRFNDEMGWTVRCESDSGQTSRFRFTP